MRCLIALLMLAVSTSALSQVYLGHGDAIDERSEIFELGFGRAVVPFGDELLVSADDQNVAIFVYRPAANGWRLHQELGRPDYTEFNPRRLGHAMIRAGERVIAGAPHTDEGDLAYAGAVYSLSIDDATGDWYIDQTLVDPAPAAGAQFGRALAYADGRLYVGAPHHAIGDADEPQPEPGPLGGRVHVYTLDDDGRWQWERSLAGDSDVGGAGFGASLAATPGRLLVGAPGETDGAGSVYWFGPAPDFAPLARLARPADAGRAFGRSVSIAGDRALVGAFDGRFTPWQNPASGTAHVVGFTATALEPVATFAESAAGAFGLSVAMLDEQQALVGAPGDRTVYHYIETDGAWDLVQTVFEPVQTAHTVRSFGEVLTMADGRLFVGAPQAIRHMGMAMAGGVVYELPLLPPPLSDLTVSLSGPSDVAANSAFDVSIVVRNDGTETLDATYLDIRPQMSPLPPGCLPRFSGMRCELGAIAPGAERMFGFTGVASSYPPMGPTGVTAYAGSEHAEADTSDNFRELDIRVEAPPDPQVAHGGGALGWLAVFLLLAMLKSRIRLRRSAPCSARTSVLPDLTPNSR